MTIDLNNPKYTEEVKNTAFDYAKEHDRELIEDIVVEHARRTSAVKMQRRLNQAMGSMARRFCGWNTTFPEDERKRISSRADNIVYILEKGLPIESEADIPIVTAMAPFVAATLSSRATFDNLRKQADKTLVDRATNLLVYPFVEAITGVGAGSLAALVGEAGNLLNYGTHQRLWKRLGLAVITTERIVNGEVVIEGRRQGSPGAGATVDDWLRHGYSPRRRAIVWNIGQALIKRNGEGEYRQSYLDRKQYELARNPEMRKGWAANRAQRYMEKRLIANMWRAWRISAVAYAEEKGIIS